MLSTEKLSLTQNPVFLRLYGGRNANPMFRIHASDAAVADFVPLIVESIRSSLTASGGMQLFGRGADK